MNKAVNGCMSVNTLWTLINYNLMGESFPNEDK